MINPKLMCMQHISGEHREIHALKGSLERTKTKYDNCEKHRKNLTTLARDGLIELKSLGQRHEELVKYFDNHDSPIGKIPTFQYLPEDVARAEVDKQKAMRDLIDRPHSCKPEGYCRKHIEQEKRKGV